MVVESFPDHSSIKFFVVVRAISDLAPELLYRHIEHKVQWDILRIYHSGSTPKLKNITKKDKQVSDYKFYLVEHEISEAIKSTEGNQ